MGTTIARSGSMGKLAGGFNWPLTLCSSVNEKKSNAEASLKARETKNKKRRLVNCRLVRREQEVQSCRSKTYRRRPKEKKLI